MVEPETNRPGEREEKDRWSSDAGRSGSNAGGVPGETSHEHALAEIVEPAPAGAMPHDDGGEEVHDLLEEPDAEEAGFGEFAENVVSGLEQAGLGLDEPGTFDPDLDEGSGVAETPEAFFAEWGSFDAGPPSPPSPPVQSAADRYAPGQAAAERHPHSFQTLSGMGLAHYGDRAGGPAAGAAKHDELADAVQSALLSIYGDPEHLSVATEHPGAAFPGEPSPSGMSWNTGLDAGAAPVAADGLSPQDVILNYFDYAPDEAAHNGSMPDAAPSIFAAAAARAGAPPPANRYPPDQTAPQRSRGSNHAGRNHGEAAAETKAKQYSGPAAFPVPAAQAVSPRQQRDARLGQESSRLLGAAAIGLMGGIAIAVSLAAFLIYGPRQASVEIPGLGRLRIDKDEQGYGQPQLEEASREPQRTVTVKAAPEFSSEILAADMTATSGQPSPLSISIRSQMPFEKTLVSITGVPEGGRLSAGVDAGGGNWLLPPRRLSGLTINLPSGSPENVPIQVQLLDSNARTPLSAKSEFVMHLKPANPSAAAAPQTGLSGFASAAANTLQSPAASLPFNTQTVPQPQPQTLAAAVPAMQPPPAAPAARPAELDFKTQTVKVSPPSPATPPFQASLVPGPAPAAPEAVMRRANPRPEIEDLLREGNKRMREGDILEARQFYQKAVALGDPEAALAMGRSYDPIYFARIDRKNAEPDAAKAFDWYRKAMDGGATQTAMVRIENLKHFLNE